MDMKFPLLIISGLFLILSFEIKAQAEEPKPSEQSKEVATPQAQLKEGVLLVRLKTKSRKVKALQEAGRPGEAQSIINEQKIENDLIMSAFDQSYTYSKVYFFYGYNGKKVLDKQWEGILMDANKNPVQVSPDTFFLIAEFGETQGRGIDGLIIYDSQGHQMSRPFPYLTKKKYLLNLASRSHGDMIKMFQKSLL